MYSASRSIPCSQGITIATTPMLPARHPQVLVLAPRTDPLHMDRPHTAPRLRTDPLHTDRPHTAPRLRTDLHHTDRLITAVRDRLMEATKVTKFGRCI